MRKSFAVASGVILALLVLAGHAQAQSSASAEARLKQLNITLPSVSTPSANFVNYVQTGKLLFLAGNTPGDWPHKGKLGRDLTVEQGYQAARQAGLIMLAKCAPRWAASIGSSASSRFSAWSTQPTASATSPRW